MDLRRILYSTLFLLTWCGANTQTAGEFTLKIGSPDSSEYASAFLVDEHEDIYMASVVFHRNDRRSRLKLFKISKDGKVLWSKLYPEKNATVFSIIKQADGNLILAGGVQDSTGNYTLPGSCYLIKTDPLGTILWEKYFKCGDRGHFTGMYQMGDALVLSASGYSDSWAGYIKHNGIIKTDLAGKQLWKKEFEIEGKENSTLLTPLKNGNLLFLQVPQPPTPSTPILFLTIKPNGKIRTKKNIKGAGIISVVEKPNGQLVFLTREDMPLGSGEMEPVYSYSFKKILGDSLITIRNIGAQYSFCPMQMFSGICYIPFFMEKQMGVVRMSSDFMTIETALIVTDDKNNKIDGVQITRQEEVLFSSVLQEPLTPPLAPNTKSKFNYDILLQKKKLAPLFKH